MHKSGINEAMAVGEMKVIAGTNGIVRFILVVLIASPSRGL